MSSFCVVLTIKGDLAGKFEIPSLAPLLEIQPELAAYPLSGFSFDSVQFIELESELLHQVIANLKLLSLQSCLLFVGSHE
ncbi:hypothetical protein JCGZ_06397 [Jatropha curcas]|uniref:Uncharacterized protein n=1 Tax=Jatropha curcas TaxID=180498 RepID=A0A067KNZ4_JATCU|nr:hypothetical protein JCGZ_06397 [Jatropha curcas]